MFHCKINMHNQNKPYFRKLKGMSLTEMLVAISILVIGMFGFSLLFIKTWQTNSFVLEEGQSVAAVSRAVNEMITNLREVKQAEDGSFAVKSGDDFDLIVYLDEDNDDVVERIHYYLDLDNDDLIKGIAEPSGSPPTYPANDTSTTILAHYIVNSDTQPVFYYYDNNYAGGSGSSLATPITPYDARLIKINLWINIKPLTAPDNVNLESFVELRNLNEN